MQFKDLSAHFGGSVDTVYTIDTFDTIDNVDTVDTVDTIDTVGIKQLNSMGIFLGDCCAILGLIGSFGRREVLTL